MRILKTLTISIALSCLFFSCSDSKYGADYNIVQSTSTPTIIPSETIGHAEVGNCEQYTNSPYASNPNLEHTFYGDMTLGSSTTYQNFLARYGGICFSSASNGFYYNSHPNHINAGINYYGGTENCKMWDERTYMNITFPKSHSDRAHVRISAELEDYPAGTGQAFSKKSMDFPWSQIDCNTEDLVIYSPLPMTGGQNQQQDWLVIHVPKQTEIRMALK